MSEHGKDFRYRTFRSAKIFPHDGGAIECSVHKISTKGASIEVENSKLVPSNFFLMIQGLSDRFRCYVVSRNENMIGVEYY